MKKQLESTKHIQILIKESNSNELKNQYIFEISEEGYKYGEIIISEINISDIKAAVINHCWFSDTIAADALLKEATMRAWEMGFELMIGTCSSAQLKNNGFKKLTLSSQEIFCTELTWNALERVDLKCKISFNFSNN